MSGEVKELNNAIQRITHSVVVHTPKYSKYGGYDGDNDIYTMDIAKALHAEGYRKQSGWISVDERLPRVSGKYICCEINGWAIPADWSLEMKTWFGEFGEIKNKVTHWMPLPEPPRDERR